MYQIVRKTLHENFSEFVREQRTHIHACTHSTSNRSSFGFVLFVESSKAEENKNRISN